VYGGPRVCSPLAGSANACAPFLAHILLGTLPCVDWTRALGCITSCGHTVRIRRHLLSGDLGTLCHHIERGKPLQLGGFAFMRMGFRHSVTIKPMTGSLPAKSGSTENHQTLGRTCTLQRLDADCSMTSNPVMNDVVAESFAYANSNPINAMLRYNYSQSPHTMRCIIDQYHRRSWRTH